jgi:hypothetical protein
LGEHLAALVEQLRAKLAQRVANEALVYSDLDRLLAHYQKSTNFIVDSRLSIESL